MRVYLQEAIHQVLIGEIEPGKVFDRTISMEGIPDAYQAMERREAAPRLGCTCSFGSRGEEARMTDDRVPPATVQDECIRLSAPGVEVLLDVSRAYPVVLHWGAPTADVTPGAARVLADGGASHGDLDEPGEPGMLREGARGFTGRPALRAHRGARDFSPLFRVDDCRVDDDRVEDAVAVLQLTAAAAGLALEQRLTMTPQGVLLLDTTLTNTGRGVYTLDELAVWLPVPDSAIQTTIFATDGLANDWLTTLHLIDSPVNWLGQPETARFVIILGLLWRWTGYNMIFYLAGLQNIDPTTIEAAKIDGAGAIRTFWPVTLPQLRPMILLTVIMSTNGTLQLFDESYNLTRGGRAYTSMSMSHYLYEVSFQRNPNSGYGAALSYVILIMVAILAAIQMRVGGKRD